jgi:SpoIVB peptidase S55
VRQYSGPFLAFAFQFPSLVEADLPEIIILSGDPGFCDTGPVVLGPGRTVVVKINPIQTWWLASVVLLLSSPVWASDFMPVSEISRGMKGYGLTVFEGSRIDTFSVEVIGVQEKTRVAGSLILIEVSGHDLDRSSIAQGMSGSPIYIEGRFAGALAFGWAGSLKSVAGVTPAGDMFGIPREPEMEILSSASPQGGMAQDMTPLLQGHFVDPEFASEVLGETLIPVDRYSETSLWPGAENLIQTLLQDVTAQAGLSLPAEENWYCNPVGQASGVGGSSSRKSATLVPGAACAVPLVTGDAMLGVTGTVTWAEDDNVLMMGHPFMQRGPVNLPLATAEILTVLPSRQMSFKMGSIGEIVGSVHHDQRAGLSGKLGPAPRMIPVIVEVSLAGQKSGSSSVPRRYEFQVVDDALLTPSLVFWTLYNSILAEGDDASNQNVSYEVTSHWKGPGILHQTPLVVRGMAAGPGGAVNLAGDWMAPFSLLLDNPFEKVELDSVEAHLVLSRPMTSSRVTGLDAPRNLRPSSGPLRVQVEITPRLGRKEVVDVELHLPGNLKPGPYRLVAASAAEFFALEIQRAAGRFQVTSLDGAVGIISMARAADDLVVALLAPGQSLMVADREMENLPGSVSRLLQGGNMQIQPTMADFAARSSHSMPYVVQGHAVRKVRVLPSSTPIREEKRP